jgi:hypothetical protein
MANRNDSDARDQETLPGPGPGINRALSRSSGVRPVEQMVDAAIERIDHERRAQEQRARARDGEGRVTDEPVALARAREREGGHELDLAPYESHAPIQRAAKPSRLRWKGLDVSEEFRTYAERVARGEDLPPFEGRVLAEPNESFPWDPGAPQHPERDEGHGSRTALWCSAAVVLALLTWTIAARFEEPAPIASDVPAAFEAKDEPPRTALPHDVVESAVVESAPLDRPAAPASSQASADEAPAGAAQPAHEASSPNGQVAGAASAVVSPVITPPAARAAAPTLPAPSPSAKSSPTAAPVPVNAALARASELDAAPVAKTPREDNFGILPEADPSSTTLGAAPAQPSAAKSAPVAAGSVGDLARVGEPLPAGVRKEPERESSAKGSLLVETPPF